MAHTAAKSRHALCRPPPFLPSASRFIGANAAAEKTASRRTGIEVVCWSSVVCSHRSRPAHMYRTPPPTTSSRSPLLGIRNWDNGTTTDENGTFQVWGCCGNLCRQPSNQRACRVFFPCPLARGWVAGLARRFCVRALEPVRGGCNLSDSDPSPARCQLKKQTSPTSCSGLGCWSQSFATLATRKNPARHASLVRQPRPITTRTHPTVGSMSPLPRRLRLVRRTDAIGFQNRRGMRLNRQGGAGIVRHFFPSPVTMT